MSKTETHDGREQKETRDPEDLTPHPYSARLYRQRVPSRRFIEDIAEQMEEPLVINEDGEIIDGVRRWLAALELGMDSVEVLEEPNRSSEEEQAAILRHNDDRDETFSQKMRVALEYEEMIAPRLEKRMKAGKSLDEQEDDPLLKSKEGENATANELAADRVGWGQTKYWQAKAIWDAKESGDETARKLVSRLDDPDPDPDDEISVNEAYESLHETDETPRDEDYISRGLTDQDDYAEEKTEAYGPVQASFVTNKVKLRRLFEKSTPFRDLNEKPESEEGEELDLYLEVQEEEVRTMTSEQIHVIQSRHSFSDDYFEEITLKSDAPIGIVLDGDLMAHKTEILQGRKIRVELRGSGDSSLADGIVSTDGSLHAWIAAPELHEEEYCWFNPESS